MSRKEKIRALEDYGIGELGILGSESWQEWVIARATQSGNAYQA